MLSAAATNIVIFIMVIIASLGLVFPGFSFPVSIFTLLVCTIFVSTSYRQRGILLLQLANQMQEVVSRRRERVHAMGERMQPMVVLVGELSAMSSAYVIVDNVTWQVQTAVKAVDICFNAYHVLHAHYPVESHVWMLQLYSFSTKWDVVSPTVNAVVFDLSK
jgi:hypothetical protein